MTSAKIDIHRAAGDGNLGEVKAFLTAGGMIDKRDADRWTPLMLSVREGHLEVARQLLWSGAALEAKDGDKWTAMHVAAANGHAKCCQLLLDRGGNPRAVDENKRTPLHWATRYGYAAVVELLLQRGADPNSKDAEGKTPGDVVGSDLNKDSREIVLTLLKEHAEKEKTNKIRRRGSCPAVPRAANISAVNVSSGVSSASAAAGASLRSPPIIMSSDKNQALLPLPLIVVTSKNDAGTALDRKDLLVEDGFAEAGQSSRHNSFSAAAHIRDHQSTESTQGRPADTMSTAVVSAVSSSVSSVPSLATLATSVPGQISLQTLGQNPCIKNTGGATTIIIDDTIERIGSAAKCQDGGSGDDRDSEVATLKKQLRAAEERARALEQLLAETEERRLRGEERAQSLEKRVTELERCVI